jgi:hypothetical protein
MDLYQYSRSAPMNATDPDGKQTKDFSPCGKADVDLIVAGAFQGINLNDVGLLTAAARRGMKPIDLIGWIIFRFTPGKFPECCCPPNGEYGWMQFKDRKDGNGWAQDNGASAPVPNPNADPQPIGANAWYGGQGWNHEGADSTNRAGTKPSSNTADKPADVGATDFKTLLVCVSTGKVFADISWKFDGTVIVPASIVIR